MNQFISQNQLAGILLSPFSLDTGAISKGERRTRANTGKQRPRVKKEWRGKTLYFSIYEAIDMDRKHTPIKCPTIAWREKYHALHGRRKGRKPLNQKID